MPLDANIPLMAGQSKMQNPAEMIGQAYEMAGAIQKQQEAQQQREDLNRTQEFLKAGGNLDTPEGVADYASWAKENLSSAGYMKSQEFVQGAKKNFLERQAAAEKMKPEIIEAYKKQGDLLAQGQNEALERYRQRVTEVGEAQAQQELPQIITQKRDEFGRIPGAGGQPLYGQDALNNMFNPEWSPQQLESRFKSTEYGRKVFEDAEKLTLEKRRVAALEARGGTGAGQVDEGLAEADRELAAMGMSRQQVVGGIGAAATSRWANAQSGAISDIQKEYGGISKREAARIFANRQQIRKADTNALQGLEKDISSITPYKEMLDTNADIAMNLADKVVKTDVRFANRSLNWLRTNATDNPDVAEFLAQNHFVTTEAARVLQNPRLVGQLTVEAQREMRDIISGDMPINSYKRVLNRIKKDGDNRVDAMVRQRDRLLGISPYESGAPTGMAAAAPPELRTRTGTQPSAGGTSYDTEKEARYQAWKRSQGK